MAQFTYARELGAVATCSAQLVLDELGILKGAAITCIFMDETDNMTLMVVSPELAREVIIGLADFYSVPYVDLQNLVYEQVASSIKQALDSQRYTDDVTKAIVTSFSTRTTPFE